MTNRKKPGVAFWTTVILFVYWALIGLESRRLAHQQTGDPG